MHFILVKMELMICHVESLEYREEVALELRAFVSSCCIDVNMGDVSGC